MKIEIGITVRSAVGQTVSGDVAFTLERAERHLVVVVDGIGHGPPAEEAAEKFRSVVLGAASARPEELLEIAHRELRNTRGAAGHVLSFDLARKELTGAGVGNVALRTNSTRVRSICSPGIVGKRMHRVRAFVSPLERGDLLLLHSDGIGSRFDLEEIRSRSAIDASEYVVAQHGKDHDDKSCAIVRIL